MWCLKVICFKLRFPFGISSAWLPRFMVCFLLLCEFIIKHPSGAVLHGAVDKETRMRQASRRGLPNVKKQWAYGLPYLNFRACFMTSTIYSSSAKTIVVSELKSTLRDSSHLSASSRRSEMKIRCENTHISWLSRFLLFCTRLYFSYILKTGEGLIFSREFRGKWTQLNWWYARFGNDLINMRDVSVYIPPNEGCICIHDEYTDTSLNNI